MLDYPNIHRVFYHIHGGSLLNFSKIPRSVVLPWKTKGTATPGTPSRPPVAAEEASINLCILLQFKTLTDEEERAIEPFRKNVKIPVNPIPLRESRRRFHVNEDIISNNNDGWWKVDFIAVLDCCEMRVIADKSTLRYQLFVSCVTQKIPWESLNSIQVIGAVGFMNQRLDMPKDIDPHWASILESCWLRFLGEATGDGIDHPPPDADIDVGAVALIESALLLVVILRAPKKRGFT
ncbi:hypothetical protein CASFOL_014584 [Castilleja foliolosa]|uniref:Uncharacterized protein n=1 Tax=Castilleja foliolosa TaxID=1961234 RepID=A0ABD3DPH9_9LAMI